MRNNRVKILMLLAYCFPYVYLSMYGDSNFRTIIFYVLMMVCFGILLRMAIKKKAITILIIGNFLSFISSYIFISKYQEDNWNAYFKPFGSFDFLIVMTGTAFLIQLLVIVFSKMKSKH